MSIIIAKIEEESCLFLSDTRVSILNGDISVTGDNKLRMNPNEGILKIHIIHPGICIAFAGNVGFCEQIIHKICRRFPLELNEILLYLQEGLILEKDNSEFIIGSYYCNNLELYKVNDKQIEKGDSFWIGSKDAFSSP